MGLHSSLFVHWMRVWPWGLLSSVCLIFLRPEPMLYWVESWHYAPLRDPVRTVVVDWVSSPLGQWAMRSERALRDRIGLPNESMPSAISNVDEHTASAKAQASPSTSNPAAAHPSHQISTTKPPNPPSCFAQPKKILLVGDSMMQGLGPWLQRQFKPLGAQVLDQSKHSTGLVNKVYYNWPDKLATLMEQHQPDMVMVMLGTNDHLDMVIEDKQYARYRSEAWHARYSERVQQMALAALNRGATVVWIGLPAMREAWYEDAAKTTSPIFEREMRALGMPFVDARPVLLEPSETYSHYLNQGDRKVLARASDGIHLAPYGNQLLVKSIVEHLRFCPLPLP
jgi:uncharacterized protein